MTLEIKRKEKESQQSLVRRFTKTIKKSGILVRTRKNRFRRRPKSGQAQKRAALRRKELEMKYEKLKKMGKSENYKR
jgi:ribosomal protein S21